MIKKIVMKNLTCASCIAKIERRVGRLPYANSASFNYTNQILLVDFKDDFDETLALKEIKGIVDVLEDNIDTHYLDRRTENPKPKFVHDYLFPLIGGGIIAIVFILFRFPGYVNAIFKTDFAPLIVDPFRAIGYWIGYLFLVSRIFTMLVKGIKNKSFFDENTLMFIATLAGMALGKYEESIAVIVLYSVGELLQNRAVMRSKDEITALMDIKVDYANVVVGESIVVKDPMQIKVGDILVIKNGERVPVDGVVTEGTSSINTSELTGEVKLQRVEPGKDILSGNINVGDVIRMRASKEYSESTLAKIIDLIENSTNNKSKTEMFITKFSRVYTPIVVGLAVLMIVYGAIWGPKPFIDWANPEVSYLYRAATFLVISCPCSLVLSVPLSYFAGIGVAAKNGILFKGSTFLQTLTDVKTIALDKTGTLTYGSFFVSSFTNDETLKVAASLEKYSNHPIAHAITGYFKEPTYELTDVSEVPGFGIRGMLGDEPVFAGSRRFLQTNDVEVSQGKLPVGSYTFVARGGKYLGSVVANDELKETSMETVRNFTKRYDTVMLTGDNEASAADIAMKLGGIEYYADLLPEQKLEKFNAIRTNSVSLYVGDGINDAPLLKNADIGVSMGSASDLAIEVSDIIIINNDIRLLDKAIKIAKRTRLTATENIVFSLTVKAVFLFLSAIGVMWMWLSIFADVGVTLLCVLNALRIIYIQRYLRVDKKEKKPK
ncbi:MAG TPA: cadmium-translocating P-type ATPase [Acholeplasmatales bacterium]|nr:MAG: cadmium-translocating P-type ATPase [Tenericutes bacterium GWF2_57_13]HAQ56356.1 cadmium-translocating P-type ATPase [Acholeplasmatales bacterium]